MTYHLNNGSGSSAVRENPRPYFRTSLQSAANALPLLKGSASGVDIGEEFQETGFFSSLRYIGQAGGTYLIFSAQQEILLIDQHAAHERILFEKLRNGSSPGKTAVQPLLIPEVIPVTPGESAVLSGFTDIFNEIGFDISLLGADTVVIKSIPSFLPEPDTGRLVKDIISELAEHGKTTNVDESRDKVLASVACKAAVKAHDRVTDREVAELCRDLDRTPNASTCPHGRPVYIKFPFRELERMFKR